MSSIQPDNPTGELDMSQTFAFKASLRKSMLKILRQIPESELKRQSSAVFKQLSQLDAYKNAKNVGCYLSMAKGELQTDEIVKDLLDRGVKLYTPYLPPPPPITSSEDSPPRSLQPSLPSTSPSTNMQMLRLYSSADLAACPLDKWGILDPGESRRDTGEQRESALDSSAADLDLILVPGVAFDVECNRLGRGKAYYDRYLAQYTSTRKSPILLALALSPQLLEPDQTVPITETDFRLDGVVTPDEIIWRE